MAKASPPFWHMSGAPAVSLKIDAMVRRSPPGYEVVHGDVETRASAKLLLFEPRDPEAGDAAPVPEGTFGKPSKLIITDPDFAPDFIDFWGAYCSESLRSLFDFEPGVVQFFPVDCSLCPPAARARNYMRMGVLARRSVMDLEKSRPMRLPWADGERILAVRDIVFKDGASSDVPIFRDPHDSRWFVTDAFAERILRAGIEDVAFADSTSRRRTNLKTL
jgi:uncharacterized protein DUF1629